MVVAVVVLTGVLAVPAAAQQPPPPPEPELPVISPTVCLDHEPETAADYNAFFGGVVGMWQAAHCAPALPCA